MQRRRAGTEIGRIEPIEGALDGIQVAVQILRLGVDVTAAPSPSHRRLALLDVIDRHHPVGGIVRGVQLAQPQHRSVVLRDLQHFALNPFGLISRRRGMKSISC
jgi:hypothetical protein